MIIKMVGVLGALGGIWYGLTHATQLGVSKVLFGEEIGDFVQFMIISSIDIVNAILPYVAFFGGIIVLLFIIIVPIIDRILKRKDRLATKNESSEIIAMKIRKLSEQLEETLKAKEK